MAWFIVWSYVLAGGHHNMAFGPYKDLPTCQLGLVTAPYDPKLDAIEPQIRKIENERFDCVLLDNPDAILERVE